ncbi:MAG: hypothetical protein HY319_04525 [Armatimonadetes bacterium]|nr:hypothetical protein [Armatimonadota bacterium]
MICIAGAAVPIGWSLVRAESPTLTTSRAVVCRDGTFSLLTVFPFSTPGSPTEHPGLLPVLEEGPSYRIAALPEDTSLPRSQSEQPA